MASTRLTAFASHVQAGHHAVQAARLAGYKESYATHHSHLLTRAARAAGLLPTPEEVRDIKRQVLDILRDEAVDVARSLAARAKKDDTPAAREVLARAVGPVPKVHYVVDLDELRKHAQAMLAMAREELGDSDAVRRLGERWAAYFDGLAPSE